jgi:hypothetical protein
MKSISKEQHRLDKTNLKKRRKEGWRRTFGYPGEISWVDNLSDIWGLDSRGQHCGLFSRVLHFLWTVPTRYQSLVLMRETPSLDPSSPRHFLLLLESWERDCNCDFDWNQKLAVSYTNWFVSAACSEMLPKGSRACVGLGHAYKRQWSCEKRGAFVWAGECLIQTIFLTGYTKIG